MTGQQALGQLQTILRQLADYAGRQDYEKVFTYGERAAGLIRYAVCALDEYLTGKTDNRNPDVDQGAVDVLVSEGVPWTVYLSDGGYSRLHLQFTDPGMAQIRFDSGSGGGIVQTTRDHWRSLLGPLLLPERGDPAELDQARVLAFCARHGRIETIRYIRNLTGLGLRDSKDTLDRLLADSNKEKVG